MDLHLSREHSSVALQKEVGPQVLDLSKYFFAPPPPQRVGLWRASWHKRRSLPEWGV